MLAFGFQDFRLLVQWGPPEQERLGQLVAERLDQLGQLGQLG
jgi:hypothetical protein